MLNFAANLSMLFTEADFMDRFREAARAGFRGVECQFPYQHDKFHIAEQLSRYGLTQVLHNLPAGDWSKGERGIACLPDRTGEFRAGLELAVEYATALGCQQLNCLAGIAPDGVPPEEIHRTFVDNLAVASARLERAGIRLLIEPINTRDTPGFYLSTSAQALAIIDEVGSDNLRLQYDVYHMRVMGDDLAPAIERHLGRIGHLQLADNPGRHEPGTGDIDFDSLFDWIDDIGYRGWIGCEYAPATTTVAGLSWLARRQPHG